MTERFSLDARVETWPLKRPFTISRGSISEAHTVSVTVRDGELSGRGEAVPSARYGQTTESALALLEAMKQQPVLDRQKIQKLLPPAPPGTRSTALCGIWKRNVGQTSVGNPEHFAARRSSNVIHDQPRRAEAMGAAARESNQLPILKLKLGGDDKSRPCGSSAGERGVCGLIMTQTNRGRPNITKKSFRRCHAWA